MIDVEFNFDRIFYSYKFNSFDDGKILLNANIFALMIKSISADGMVVTKDDTQISSKNIFYTIQDCAKAIEEHYNQLDFETNDAI